MAVVPGREGVPHGPVPGSLPGRRWPARGSAGRQERAGSCQALADEGEGELFEVMPGGIGDVAQRSLPGEHGQPVHGGPDGVLDAVAGLPAEHAGVDQLVEYGAELTQGCAVLPGPVVRSAVGVLLWQGERGGEPPWFLAGELQVRGTDRAQPAAGRGGIAVLAAHAGDAGGHAVGELAHGRRADRGEELVTVGEVPVRGVGHPPPQPGRLTEHHGAPAAATPGALRVFERVAAAEQDADTVWLTLLPGFPDGSYGWAQVDRMLGDDLGPRLYVEPVGQGDSDKPRDYPYSTVERADLVEALWRHHGVRRTVVVTFDYTSLALLELLRRQTERTTSRGVATPAHTAALMINRGLFADAHTHPWRAKPGRGTP